MRFAMFLAAASLFVLPLTAQRVYTAHDYQQAERWMSYNVKGLVYHTVGDVEYLKDGRIFYRDPGAKGVVYMVADPKSGVKAPAFDNAKLAETLRKVSKREVKADALGVQSYVPDERGSGFTVDLGWAKFHCVTDAMCTQVAEPGKPVERATKEKTKVAKVKPTAVPVMAPHGRKSPNDVSPDGKLAAFIRDNNLWVRVVATGEEHPLTTDGVKDFGYATDNAGWIHSDAPILDWSNDSKKIATFQLDERKTGMMYLVSVTNRHPELKAWHYPFVGDKDVTMIEPVVIDVDTAKVVRLQMPPEEHRTTECDDVSCKGGSGWNDVEFSPDGKHLAFVSTSRDHKDEWLRVADTATGAVRTVFHVHVPTYYGWQSNVNWWYLPESDEFIWCSERSNFAQYYLYDLTTGKLKNQITHGDGPVQDLLHVDAKNRVIYFMAAGKQAGENPYWEHYYRVNFDGSDQRLLTPEAANHTVTAAPDGSSFVDVYSTVDKPETAVVRDNNGKLLLTLAKQDIAPLLAAGWKPPVPFTVKARDGKTDLYGIMWKPTWFDAAKDAAMKLPVVDYVYPGPQDGGCFGVDGHKFHDAVIDHQSMADLGFVVVCIDGMGNPHRSKSFHDAHASTQEDMGDDTIPDQVAGVKQLAARYAWVDGTRVGIWGHSGGGRATVTAMFHYGDFFKVGWAESGNYDNREYEDDWDERWGGLEVVSKDGKSNYDSQALEDYASGLQGKLMLVDGTMDDNVPPNNTLVVVDALIKANKDFDLLELPNMPHGYREDTPYVRRRCWDYFVRNLAGGVPPVEYKMMPYKEEMEKMYGE
jgi:dipeptidyl-peptidase-4